MSDSVQLDFKNIDGAVILKPYLSQVGGHNVFLKYDASTICKPFHPHEYHFYKKLSPSLKNFIPQFRGLARVKRMVSANSNEIYYIAIPIDDSALNSSDYLQDSLEERNLKIEQLEENNMTQDQVDTAVQIIEQNFEGVAQDTLESKISHPWIVESRRKFDIKWIKYNYDTKVFMLLENITANFEYPSILDLKIGFRAHGDHTHETKRKRKEERINNSTSAICGIRLCGMQKFDPITKKFLFVDKYHGRKINLNQLKDTLYDFFKIKDFYHIYFIVILIIKIKRLTNTLRTHNSLRLFATSLLVVFENQDYTFEPVSRDSYFLYFPPLLQAHLEQENFHITKSDFSSLSKHISLATLFDDIEKADKNYNLSSLCADANTQNLTGILVDHKNSTRHRPTDLTAKNHNFTIDGYSCDNNQTNNIDDHSVCENNINITNFDKNADIYKKSDKSSSFKLSSKCISCSYSSSDNLKSTQVSFDEEQLKHGNDNLNNDIFDESNKNINIEKIQNNKTTSINTNSVSIKFEKLNIEDDKNTQIPTTLSTLASKILPNDALSNTDGNNFSLLKSTNKQIQDLPTNRIESNFKNSKQHITKEYSFDKNDVLYEKDTTKMNINKMLKDSKFFEKYGRYVNIKLIDFAQASFVGTSDTTFIDTTIKNVYSKHAKSSTSDENFNRPKVTANLDHLRYKGPDYEFLTGLENICIFFESLLYSLFTKK